MARVVVTGMAGISPLGCQWEQVLANLQAARSGVCRMPGWDVYRDLNTRLAAPAAPFELPEHFTRKRTRSMGRVSLMATLATEWALTDAGLLNDPGITDGRMGVSYGSSIGTTSAIADFGRMLLNHDAGCLNANSYIKMMSHTATVNLGVFFGLKGRTITTTSACTSGSQGIGYAFEAIRFGRQKLMVAGGADELCATEAAVFDTLFATSVKNDTPERTPSPFDRERDGLVIGEGAGTLILEDLEHARARGARIHAEVLGFACNSDGAHVTQPEASTMRTVMIMALNDAGLTPADIDYISAHGTATERGDIAESQATAQVFGAHTPIGALKSYTGHTLGACGALEAWVAIGMMRGDWFHGTLNLNDPDPRCGELDYLRAPGRNMTAEIVMSNNFAFGGINTSLIFRRW